MRKTQVLVYIAALTLGAAQLTQAQSQQQPQQPPASSQQPAQPPSSSAPAASQTVTSADVTDQEVEQFAKIYEDVAQIRKDTEKQLEGTQDTAEATRVKQEANHKMAEAVQGHGMKVERFNLIARSIDQDSTLKQRIQQKLQELRQPA